jgi:hypothetical protein
LSRLRWRELNRNILYIFRFTRLIQSKYHPRRVVVMRGRILDIRLVDIRDKMEGRILEIRVMRRLLVVEHLLM